MNDENFREVYKTLHNSQDKYVYFILATTIAAIGFAITRTQNLKLNINQIPLLISVISWGISFLCGCINREYVNSTLYANSELLKVESGQHPKVGIHPQLIKAASEGIREAMISNSNKANKLGKGQMCFFMIGVFFYLVWHIIVMSLNK
ncbi:hypothetical protein [Clostridium sp. 001]|uniref:hypothetical protein n=1 Tax=Clostridium sp. 001 TaxID=1970093 RepID=UPI001C2CBEB1|nr:hypothetical protein [Clostridium sp. 001]QXE20044.1 hypothetical protein B5S50_15090 [Clostridium sp. 001]